MENKINKDDFKFLYLDFIQRTNLRLAPKTLDINGQDSLKHLQNIIESDKPMIQTVCLEHATVKETFQTLTDTLVNGTRIKEYHFIWGRMMLEFYYFYHDAQEESLKVVDQMLYYEGVLLIKEAVRTGMTLIDEYYKKEWSGNTRDTHPIKTPSVFSPLFIAPNKSDSVPELDILQIMQGINDGTINFKNVDWVAQIKEILKLCGMMTQKYPHILWLWNFVNHIDEPTKRMEVLCEIRDAAPKCFDDVFEARDFQEDCQCLYRICCDVRGLKLNNKVKIVHTWNDADRKSLNDLAYMLNDDSVDANFMVALAEEIYRSGHEGKNHNLTESILRCNRYRNKLSINNIIDFSKALYSAEGYRQCLLSGNPDYNEFPNLKNFKRKLRNACFDVYIELRAEQIKCKIAEDNEIVDDPDDIEYYLILQKEEEAVAKREISFEQFRGSRAYNALWYEGRDDVLKMTNMFIQHLPNYIAKKRLELSSQNVNSLQLPANAPQVIIQTKEVKIKDNKGTIISDSDVSVYTK